MGGKMQNKVVEVQTADANATQSGEVCDFGETAFEFSGGKSADCLSYMWLILFFTVFALDISPVTVEQLPQATDQDNPIFLGSNQVVNVDTEQCFDSMMNNFQDACQLMEYYLLFTFYISSSSEQFSESS